MGIASRRLHSQAASGEHPLPTKGVTTVSRRAPHALERALRGGFVGEESEPGRTAPGEPERSGRLLLEMLAKTRQLGVGALGCGLELVDEHVPRRLQRTRDEGARVEDTPSPPWRQDE